MKNKIRIYIGALFICLLIGSIKNMEICRAASAQIDITSDMTEFTVGEDVLIYITINSDSLFGNFEAYLTYNDDILEYRAGASSITGSSGLLKISDMRISDGSNSRKYALKFQALKVGICKITLNEGIKVYDFESGLEMPVLSNVLSVGVKAVQTASDNTDLINLKTSPSEIEPSFDPKVYQYSMKVENKVDKLIVSAVPEDSKATVSISGNNFLQEGENKVIVTVLAESGAVIEYTIDVIRELGTEDITGTVVEDGIIAESLSGKQGSLEVIREDGAIYVIYEGKYQLTSPDSDVAIPKGYSKTEIIISDVSVTAYTLVDDLENDFLLIYAINELGKSGFYQYDRIERTMQRYLPISKINNANTTGDNSDEIKSDEYRSNLNKAAVTIALLSVICIMLIIIIIRMFLSLKGYKEDDLD